MFNFMVKKIDGSIEMQKLNELNIPAADACVYTSCFCEENVWKLCDYIRNTQKDLLQYCYVVFISNKNERTPLWCQKASGAEKFVIWDYHVIMIYKPQGDDPSMIYDLDSILTFPTPFEFYLNKAIRSNNDLKEQFHRFFRVIPAVEFLQSFASDRSRMKGPDGSWIKHPPPYPCIMTAESKNNIDDFISMDSRRGIGDVLTLEQFKTKFM